MDTMANLMNLVSLLLVPLTCLDPQISTKIATTKFDFIVVGAGTAGAVVAARLSENPNWNVLLLEAGGCPSFESNIPATTTLLPGNDKYTFILPPHPNAFKSFPNHQAAYVQGKVLGGGSTVNCMMYIRGNKYDYDTWETLGNTGWGYNGVLPYFKMSEGNTIPGQMNDTDYHNDKGPLIISYAPYSTPILQTCLESAKQTGYANLDVNGASQIGFTQNSNIMRNGSRCSTFTAFLQPPKNKPNLVIAPFAFVTKVLFNNNKAVGVEYLLNNVKTTTNASKEVVLSAGTLSTPKLLMLSGVGPKKQLEQLNVPLVMDLPGVGQNLHDHVGCTGLIWTVNCTKCTYDLKNVMSENNVRDWLMNRKGPLTVNLQIEGTGFTTTSYATAGKDVPDAQLVFLSGNIGGVFTTANGFAANLEDYFRPLEGSTSTFSIVVILIAPKSRGNFTLTSSDPTQQPVLNFNYFDDPNDIKALVEGMKAAIKLGNAPAFKAIGAKLHTSIYPGCETFNQYSDEYLDCMSRHLTFASLHPVGSCKMGPASDNMAVVDPQLNVYKMEGLRVVDNSIMPVITRGNTNTPANMIGEKGADIIKAYYK